ncbi:hypothetical protein H312_02323 [Anncaliia algerae PRA339]|uniref:Thioredoxin domain-containing protein n=1 Tax=Anncaliia algerae PRA339 TaxID=1288291 RepID=A0A059EZH3_9MICR|nr:hypothetical protein H312_02323 [Anncaliia algerae PRA339]
MILILFQLIASEILDTCTIPDTEGFILTKYYKPECPHCIKIEGYIDEIDSLLERNGIDLKMHYVDCSTCNCEEKNIKLVPTVILSQNNVEKEKIVGKANYNAYINMINNHMNIPNTVFYRHKKNIPGKVVKLKEFDFDDAFEGPWIILFNSDKDKSTRKIFEKIAAEYKDVISFGELNTKRTKKIRNKVNVQDESSILALFRGLVAEMTEERTYEKIKEFSEKLIEPSFKLMDMKLFKEETRFLKRGEPLFLVFYSDLGLANLYFKRIAHEYKFRTKFYKTNDPLLFERASIFPKKAGIENMNDNDKVILSVYKNGIFHQCPFGLEENNKIPEWIFNSHFPNLTRITNENFSSVFHGLKPVLLLVTRNDQFVDKLESFSTNKYYGLPFYEFLFAALDVDSFPKFTEYFLPTLSIPILVIYNPQTQKFYFKLSKFDKVDFNEYANRMLVDYESNKLYEYPKGKSYTIYFVILAIVVVSLFIISGIFVSKLQKYD